MFLGEDRAVAVAVTEAAADQFSVAVGTGIALDLTMLDNFVAYQYAKQFYWECKALKVHRILHDQLLRASSSVALNLSEASGRRTQLDQRRHFTIAFGSLQECRAILELEKIEHAKLHKLADDLAAILFTLSRKKIEGPSAEN
jgi:four helix bundle protein